MTRRIGFCALLVLSALAIPCCDSDPAVSYPGNLQFTADPQATTTSEAVLFSVSFSASTSTVTSTRIDYEGNGTWDESKTHGGFSVTTDYEHRYDSAGQYTARVQALEGIEVLAQKDVSITVDDLGVRLELIALDNPPVTVEVGSQGGCMMWIPYWTATIRNTPSNPPAQGWIRMYWVEMEYEWPDGATEPATYTHPIGGIIQPGESEDILFNPIDCCNHDRLGMTARVRMTFIGKIADTTDIRMVAHSELELEPCP